MALCKHLMDGGCADCDPALAASLPAGPDRRDMGPWFAARHEGDCDGCGGHIEPGDMIRADGEGGWLCSDCGTDDPVFAPEPRVLTDVKLVSWGPHPVSWGPAPVSGTAESQALTLESFMEDARRYRQGEDR